MIKLLNINISGYKMLKENFTLDLVTKAKVNDEDLMDEIIEIDENLYTYDVLAFTGRNSSGKTTVLDMIVNVLSFMNGGRWLYRDFDFSTDSIILNVDFYYDGFIYIYHGEIIKPKINYNPNVPYFCEISNESLFFAKYKKSAGKRYKTTMNYERILRDKTISDTSILYNDLKNKVSFDYLNTIVGNGAFVTQEFFDCFEKIDFDLLCNIIKLLDESIEYIKVIKGANQVNFKRINESEKIYDFSTLLAQLSKGTIKGIEVYIRAIMMLKKGGYVLIDEIESSFHKDLVNNIIYLFNDKRMNKSSSTLLFTTHYVEILDVFNRRDNIFVLQKDNSEISISNVYSDYNIRTEILKSKQFYNNTFKTLLDYEQLMKVKRGVVNEILETLEKGQVK